MTSKTILLQNLEQTVLWRHWFHAHTEIFPRFIFFSRLHHQLNNASTQRDDDGSGHFRSSQYRHTAHNKHIETRWSRRTDKPPFAPYFFTFHTSKALWEVRKHGTCEGPVNTPWCSTNRRDETDAQTNGLVGW